MYTNPPFPTSRAASSSTSRPAHAPKLGACSSSLDRIPAASIGQSSWSNSSSRKLGDFGGTHHRRIKSEIQQVSFYFPSIDVPPRFPFHSIPYSCAPALPSAKSPYATPIFHVLYPGLACT